MSGTLTVCSQFHFYLGGPGMSPELPKNTGLVAHSFDEFQEAVLRFFDGALVAQQLIKPRVSLVRNRDREQPRRFAGFRVRAIYIEQITFPTLCLEILRCGVDL